MAEKKSSKKKEEPSGAEQEGKAPPQVEPGSTQEPYRRLYRSTKNRMLAGICGGIGDYFDIDPTLVRILLVISVIAGGFGILAYIVGWIIIPEGTGGSESTQAANRSPILGIVIGTLLVVFGFGLLADRMRYWFFFPDWFRPLMSMQTFFAFGLIALGAFFILYVFKKDNSLGPGAPAGGQPAGKPHGKLYRSITDKKVSGVCGGLGEYFSIDPTFIRIIWVVGTLSTGLFPGLIAYIVMAIIVPERPVISEDAP